MYVCMYVSIFLPTYLSIYLSRVNPHLGIAPQQTRAAARRERTQRHHGVATPP